MATTAQEFSKFVKLVLAQLTDDKDTVIALKNEKTAKAALKGQISSLESKLVKDESRVELAQENLEKAKYPTTRIEDDTTYIQNIQNAQRKLDEAEDSRKNTEEQIEYFNNILKNDF